MEKCGKLNDLIMASMPEPPIAIQGLLDDYQNFLGSVFAREYQEHFTNPVGTSSKYMPKLSDEENHYIENLTKILRSSPEWKEYVNQCRQWAVNM